MNIKIFPLILFVLLSLAFNACRADIGQQPESSPGVVASPEENLGTTLTVDWRSSTSLSSLTRTVVPPAVATVDPAASVAPPGITTGNPTRTLTLSPTGTPAQASLHPLTIEYLRQIDFQGSAITIEETLKPGLNYNRYIVSYYSEGLKIIALLTVPHGEKPASGWPAIIFNHGYIPPEQYRTTELYMDHIHDLAMHGYIVFRPDYRGHGSSEGAARGAYGRPDYTIDVLYALAAIKNYSDADPERIGMWGHSMGGYLTLRCMVVSQDIKAGVIWAGVVASYPDLLSGFFSRAQLTPTADPGQAVSWWWNIYEEFGSPEENPGFWESISANSYLGDLSGPVQLHHGTGDETVPVEFSSRLALQIKDAGRSVEYYRYRGDDHNLSNRYTQAMLRTIMFFDQYLKGTGSD